MSEALVVSEWRPRTWVGRFVKEGRIKSLDDIFRMNIPIKEPEIVDFFLPNLKHEVVSIDIVQRQTDAGEVSQFQVMVVLGNEDGYVGVGLGKGKQINLAIEKAIRHAKLEITPVRRGCGSWSCQCNEPHSVPFRTTGKAGSVRIELIPAPKGVGLVAGDAAKVVLRLAGLRDVWTRTFGETRTRVNFIKATLDALRRTYSYSI